ncbi:MAG TPA: hypothetical protein VK832_08290, partial [Burkholderiaceae bacterium]|nr:hypothetical protein [Burkholderiaceae bacterium]
MAHIAIMSAQLLFSVPEDKSVRQRTELWRRSDRSPEQGISECLLMPGVFSITVQNTPKTYPPQF